jgi:hypothetical protein
MDFENIPFHFSLTPEQMVLYGGVLLLILLAYILLRVDVYMNREEEL